MHDVDTMTLNVSYYNVQFHVMITDSFTYCLHLWHVRSKLLQKGTIINLHIYDSLVTPIQVCYSCLVSQARPSLRVRVWLARLCTPIQVYVINPRRACARVTVLGLSVCVCVCLSTLTFDLQATRRFTSSTNGISATRARKIMWRILPKRPRFESEKLALSWITLRGPNTSISGAHAY